MTQNEKAVALIASSMCMVVGIAPVDPYDGSPNWWMFQDEAGKIVDGLYARFPIPEQVEADLP